MKKLTFCIGTDMVGQPVYHSTNLTPIKDLFNVFYRVEIPTKSLKFGVGPYLACNIDKLIYDNEVNITKYELKKLCELSNDLVSHHSGNPKTPAFYTDFPKELINEVNLENYHCGFTKLNDLYSWFDSFIIELNKLGYKLVKYTVMDVIIGNSKKQAFACDIIDREILPLNAII